MTVVLETIAIIAGVTALGKILRDQLRPSEESLREMKKAERMVQGFTYATFDESYLCRGVKDVSVEVFPAFVDDFQKKYKLSDKTIAAIHDIMHLGAYQGNESQFHFKNGKGGTYYEQVYGAKTDGKVSFAIARYTLSFRLNTMFEERRLLGFIPIKVKVSSDKKPLAMSEQQKEMFRKVCQGKLFKHVDEEYRNSEIAPTTD